jgi:hypothetical protein
MSNYHPEQLEQSWPVYAGPPPFTRPEIDVSPIDFTNFGAYPAAPRPGEADTSFAPDLAYVSFAAAYAPYVGRHASAGDDYEPYDLATHYAQLANDGGRRRKLTGLIVAAVIALIAAVAGTAIAIGSSGPTAGAAAPLVVPADPGVLAKDADARFIARFTKPPTAHTK